MSERPKLALSFDIECYYQIVSNDYLDKNIEPTEEVLVNTHWILDELKLHKVKATFFFLGNVARIFPELIKRAADDGHEIGIHGDEHLYIDNISPIEFEKEIASAKDAILAAGAEKVVGHRAPAFSINQENLWALDVLKNQGIVYDSSIYPISGRRYGEPEWPLWPTNCLNGMVEIPLSTVEIFSRRFPAVGGGYVRYFPYAWTRFCIKKINANALLPVAYFHPYEFEMTSPDMNKLDTRRVDPESLKRLKRFNMLQAYGRGLSMRKKLKRMLIENDIAPLCAEEFLQTKNNLPTNQFAIQ